MKRKKNNYIRVLVLLMLVTVAVLSGTYAMNLFGITIFSTDLGIIQGARLHEDNHGNNKDIYIENYAQEEGEDIFARIRISEYMELGTGAGSGTNTTVLTGGISPTTENGRPQLSDTDSWYYYKHQGAADEGDESKIAYYREFTLGGRTIYMPTFNKNNTDLSADINGTETEEFKLYQLHEVKTDTVTYYNSNTGSTAQSTQEHTAKATKLATILTMEEWKALPYEDNIGDFWVQDTDGWFYWASPIKPQEATGLLIDRYNDKVTMGEDWYYDLSIEAQMVTADELGNEESTTGFYEDGMTTMGAALVGRISGKVESVSVEITNRDLTPLDSKTIFSSVGETLDLGAVVSMKNPLGAEEEQKVIWTITHQQLGADEELDYERQMVDGQLFPVYEMREGIYTMRATSVINSDQYDEVTIYVYDKKFHELRVRAGTPYTNQDPEVDIGYTEVQQKEQFYCYADVETFADDSVIWTLTGNQSSATTLHTSTGAMVIGADEPIGTVLTVTASSIPWPEKSKSITLTVVENFGNIDSIRAQVNAYLEGNSTVQIYLGGVFYYILDSKVINGRDAILIYPEDMLFATAYATQTASAWETSLLRSKLKTWLGVDENNKVILDNTVDSSIGYAGDLIKRRAVEVDLESYTIVGTSGSTWQWEYTKDKAFVLSREEYNKYVTDANIKVTLGGTTGATRHWTRSPYNYAYMYSVPKAGTVGYLSGSAYYQTNATYFAARPAVWIYLSEEAK